MDCVKRTHAKSRERHMSAKLLGITESKPQVGNAIWNFSSVVSHPSTKSVAAIVRTACMGLHLLPINPTLLIGIQRSNQL